MDLGYVETETTVDTELLFLSHNHGSMKDGCLCLKGTLPETNSWNLKTDGWKLEYYFPFWNGLFSMAKMLVSGSVSTIGPL